MTEYLSSPPYVNGSEKDKMENGICEFIGSIGARRHEDERGGGFFACLPSLVKLMANIQDSGGKMFKVLFSQLNFYGECCATHVLGKIGFVGFDHFDDSLGFNGKIENCAKYKVVLACWPGDFI